MLNILSYYKSEPQDNMLNVWPHQLKKNPDLINSMLRYRDGLAVRRPARKLEVVEVDHVVARTFLEKNHLSGGTGGVALAYGLTDGDQLLMVITLGRPRFTKSFSLEVLRLASEQGYCVVGGASKLFSHVLREYPSETILSYSDSLIGEGRVYQSAGFTQLGATNPGYFWEKDGQILLRYKTQKHKLIKLLGPDINLALSERALMMQAGWQEVRDNGNLRWGLRGVGAAPELEKKFNYVYRITRPSIDGCYYIGVHSTDDLNDGYLGSGDRVIASLRKYGRLTHVKEMLHVCETRNAAFGIEQELVNIETLLDIKCLNLCLGGGSPLKPVGSTQGRVSVWHESGQERRVFPDEISIFLERGWQRGRHPNNKKQLHGKWFIREDGTQGRTDGDLPAGAQPGKSGATEGMRWVQRNGSQTLVTKIEPSDIVGFTQTKTNKGGKMLEKDGIRKIFLGVDAETARQAGWSSPPAPTAGKIGMRAPNGEKRLVILEEARTLARLGWVIANKQLKSAPPQVLQLAAELGLKLPKKKTVVKPEKD